MTKSVPRECTIVPPGIFGPAPVPDNPAIQSCWVAFVRTCKAQPAGTSVDDLMERACCGYREAMPQPVDVQSLRNLYGCICYGAILEIFDREEAEALLNQADVVRDRLFKREAASSEDASPAQPLQNAS
jgi:hypothetical protein